MKLTKTLLTMIVVGTMLACSSPDAKDKANEAGDDFNYVAEQFADVKILRYQVPSFDELSLKEKQLLYCLQEAAYWGREIFYDQNYEHNLYIKRTLEAVVENYKG
ncbi:MAG: dihydrofolate reductase, partial [Bacteroidales bacterium]|nr:dihydrofolate reductase [Bacteroidales bacterium]